MISQSPIAWSPAPVDAGELPTPRCRSASRSGGCPGDQLRMVIYVNIFPNILWSLHPDYVMTYRVVPLAAGRTRIESSWAFAPEAVAKPHFDPAYAVEFWDPTNRQDWAACESVQRGLSSPFATPGPLSPAEDAVYSFVTTVARGYQGTRVTERTAETQQSL
jgi:glycine betaine catabolism A